MHIYNVSKGGHAIPLKIDGEDRSKTEKNWTPLEFNGQLLFIYSFEPLVLLQCNIETGNCKVVYVSPRGCPDTTIRGGSPAHAVENGVFVGWLHTTRLAPTGHYDSQNLPIPAQQTPSVYRNHRYELTFSSQGIPSLNIGPEETFFGNQIEQIYGQIGDHLVLNVDDCYTIYIETEKKSF